MVMSATTQMMTAEELLNLPRGQFRYELVQGELLTMSPAGEEHGAVKYEFSCSPRSHFFTGSDSQSGQVSFLGWQVKTRRTGKVSKLNRGG